MKSFSANSWNRIAFKVVRSCNDRKGEDFFIMATITEFSSTHIKHLVTERKKLTDAGKDETEVMAWMLEAHQQQEQKAQWALTACEVVSKKLLDLKRVIVLQFKENEKAPSGAIQKGEYYYLAEYFPPLHKEVRTTKRTDLKNKKQSKRFPKNMRTKPNKDKETAKYGATVVIKTAKSTGQPLPQPKKAPS
jgi:hypothetical protein